MTKAFLFISLCLLSSCVSETITPVAEPKDENIEKNAVKKEYIGLTVEKAKELAVAKEEKFRVVKIDGKPQIITKDLRAGRLNATVEGGKVVSIRVE